MTEQDRTGLRKIRRAILSVSDKTGIIEFARELQRFGVELISTGGTARALRESGLAVRDISEVTGFPEMMDGRIKTLHPHVHGALLALRDNEEHQSALREHGIEPIDMVVVNLYPFEQTIARDEVRLDEAVEQIDIGGPAMIRSAAKNFRDVAVVVSPDAYSNIADELRANEGSLSLETRAALARQAFARTASYDAVVTAYLSKEAFEETTAAPAGTPAIGSVAAPGGQDEAVKSIEEWKSPPDFARWTLHKTADLRYGENPHQQAALYRTGSGLGVGAAELLGGKEMSFNNYIDADAAWQLVSDFDETACAIIKHTNPAGVGCGPTAEEAYRRALATDPVSAFGGIVAFNCRVDERAARAATEIFTEVVVAPDYDEAALAVFAMKKNLRVLRAARPERTGGLDYKQITGALLIQTRDTHRLKKDALKVVTLRPPTGEEVRALLFAWTVCKHTKSNAIVYARDGQTVGVGAGQMSRVDSVRIGARRAQLPLKGSVLASDAFFPFRDGIDEAAQHGIAAVIQPGGSVRDQEVIDAADEHGLAMVFTGVRHFKH